MRRAVFVAEMLAANTALQAHQDQSISTEDVVSGLYRLVPANNDIIQSHFVGADYAAQCQSTHLDNLDTFFPLQLQV